MEKDGSQEDNIPQMVRTTQIIVAALAIGVAAFLGFAVFSQGDDKDDSEMMRNIGVGMAVVATIMAAIVPRLVSAAQVKQIADGTFGKGSQQGPIPKTDEGKLGAVYITKTIIGCAFLDGAGFFNVYVFLSSGQLISAGIAVFLILAILYHMPSVGRVGDWISHQKAELGYLRDTQRFDG